MASFESTFDQTSLTISGLAIRQTRTTATTTIIMVEINPEEPERKRKTNQATDIETPVTVHSQFPPRMPPPLNTCDAKPWATSRPTPTHRLLFQQNIQPIHQLLCQLAPPICPSVVPSPRTKLEMVHPMVGGIIKLSEKECKAFKGGSNLEDSPPFPEFHLMRGPIKMAKSQMFCAACKTGLSIKLVSLEVKNPEMSIVLWFNELGCQMVELGLDTIFWIPNFSWKDEVHILKDWGEVKKEKVNAWRNKLGTGVNDL